MPTVRRAQKRAKKAARAAPINPPWRFDPLQIPVNVNWTPVTGLAVEFFDGAE